MHFLKPSKQQCDVGLIALLYQLLLSDVADFNAGTKFLTTSNLRKERRISAYGSRRDTLSWRGRHGGRYVVTAPHNGFSNYPSHSSILVSYSK